MSNTTTKSPQAGGGRTALLGLLLIGVLLLALVILLSLRQTLLATPTVTPSAAPAVTGVTPVEPPIALTDFTLPASTGEDVSLSDLSGDYALVFFGYTHCPDFCPTTLAEFAEIKQDLGEDAERVQFVFVSVDGERDTPDVLANYVTRFDPAFVGLQGDDETLAQIGGDYGLSYELHNDEADESGNYAVDHTTFSYLVDPQGRLRALISYNAEQTDIVAYIQSLMEADAA
jgi:protein SCO1/2